MKKYIIIIIVVVALIVAFLNIPQQKGEYIQEFYTVQQGDTLYKIALENCSKYDDIREYIEQVKKLNNKNTSNLKANEKIIILIEK